MEIKIVDIRLKLRHADSYSIPFTVELRDKKRR